MTNLTQKIERFATQTQIEQFAAKCRTSGRPMLPSGGDWYRGTPAAAVAAGLVKQVHFYSPTGESRTGFLRVGA
jgi:hypothetical protein